MAYGLQNRCGVEKRYPGWVRFPRVPAKLITNLLKSFALLNEIASTSHLIFEFDLDMKVGNGDEVCKKNIFATSKFPPIQQIFLHNT